MKHIIRLSLLLLAVAMLLTACVGNSPADTEAPRSAWDGATVTEDAAFGTGAKCVKVSVTVEDKTVVLTLHTDAETLGEALVAEGLIGGDQGPYGLYVKQVLGITADYDVDQHYWSFSKAGEMLMTGADATPIADGEVYEISYA